MVVFYRFMAFTPNTALEIKHQIPKLVIGILIEYCFCHNVVDECTIISNVKKTNHFRYIKVYQNRAVIKIVPKKELYEIPALACIFHQLEKAVVVKYNNIWQHMCRKRRRDCRHLLPETCCHVIWTADGVALTH